MGWIAGVRDRLGRLTATQLAVAIALLAALALSGSLVATGLAVRTDQREQAALAALDDYSSLVIKLGDEQLLATDQLTQGDAAFVSSLLQAISRPTRESGSVEETCRTGHGAAGVRYIRAPVGRPAGLAALATTRGEAAPGLGQDAYVVRLERGVLCPDRAVEAVVVRRPVGALEVVVGRVVDRSGRAWGWAVAAVAGAGLMVVVVGVAAATYARRRLTGAVAEVSRALDRAAVGDFSVRAPERALAPELTELTAHVNATLDRLEELLSWLRDSADQLAHDFRTPLARAATRLDQLAALKPEGQAEALVAQASGDLNALTRAMNEAILLRDGEAWTFEPVRLDVVARQAAELYEPLAEEKGVTLALETEPATVLGVETLLQRAATNLLDNAIKFAPAGSRVTVRVKGGDGAQLVIADKGPGFAVEALADPARAVSAAVAEGRESHGMGLSFVRAILKRHGAALTIADNAPGAVVTARFSR